MAGGNGGVLDVGHGDAGYKDEAPTPNLTAPVGTAGSELPAMEMVTSEIPSGIDTSGMWRMAGDPAGICIKTLEVKRFVAPDATVRVP